MSLTAYLYPLIAIFVFALMEAYCRRKGLLPIKYKKKESLGRGSGESIDHFIDVYNNSEDICFVGGECHHIFWNNPKVIEAIEKGNVQIKIASGPYYDYESNRLAKLINDGCPNIEYYPLGAREDSHHFYVSNSGCVGYHKGDEQNRETIISENVYIKTMFIQQFKKKIEDIKPIKKGEFLDHIILSKPDEVRCATDEEAQVLINYL